MRKPDAVRAKFWITCVADYGDRKEISADTVYDSSPGENKDFTDATPSGNMTLCTHGDVKAADFFTPGSEYYADFRQAPIDSESGAVEDVFFVNKIVDEGGQKEVHLKLKPQPDEHKGAHRDFSEGAFYPGHKIQIDIWKEFPAWLFFEVDKEVYVSFTKADQ